MLVTNLREIGSVRTLLFAHSFWCREYRLEWTRQSKWDSQLIRSLDVPRVLIIPEHAQQSVIIESQFLQLHVLFIISPWRNLTPINSSIPFNSLKKSRETWLEIKRSTKSWRQPTLVLRYENRIFRELTWKIHVSSLWRYLLWKSSMPMQIHSEEFLASRNSCLLLVGCEKTLENMTKTVSRQWLKLANQIVLSEAKPVTCICPHRNSISRNRPNTFFPYCDTINWFTKLFNSGKVINLSFSRFLLHGLRWMDWNVGDSEVHLTSIDVRSGVT